MKRTHIFFILALLLSSVMFAEQLPGNGKADENEAPQDTVVDTTATDVLVQSRSRIDSIRNVMSLRRAHSSTGSRRSLRSQRDSLQLAADTLVMGNSVYVRHTETVETERKDTLKTGNLFDRELVSVDSVPPKNDWPTFQNDSLLADKPSLPDTTAPKRPKIVRTKVDLDNVVDFAAKDSLVMQGENNANMYGASTVTYGQININADEINMNMKESLVHAVGRPDTTGEVVGSPVFNDKSGEYKAKTMRYNFKTGKGYITDVITQQGEGYLTGGRTKKMEDDTYYLENGRYTTCNDHEHPHFYFQLTKAKVKPKKNIVTGPAYMVLCDVPLPLAVPFGFFPFSSKYSSGIIVPSFGDDYNKGFYLRDGGYYFAISDYVDLALTGEIYTKGSWGLSAHSTYRKRYKFSGNVDVSFLKTITGDKGSPDYMTQKNFRLGWTHSQDSKANPNMSFSASVNFATSGYSRNDLNSYYDQSFTENTKNSTVNLSYRFSSKFQMSTTASISQRTQDSTLSVSFPNFTLSLSQIAPFKRKRAVGDEKWYEKIRMSYTGSFQNNLTAKQNEFFKKSLIKDWSNGMRHNIPLSATFNMFRYINVSPSIRMNDRMYTSKIRKAWDPAASAEVRDTTYGFYNVFDFNASLTLDTKIYGFFKPLKFMGDKVQMIRHVMSPSISFSASPDFSKPFWGYYGNYDYVDRNGVTQNRKYNYFSHGIFGSVGQGKTGMVNVSISNNLEMKVKSDKDSTGMKKISLIENFTIGQSYNFAADSMRWSNLNTSISLRLVKNFNLNLSATWDPYTYQLSPSGTPVRVNIPRWKAGKGWVKLSSTGTSFSYTFNNNTFKRKKKEDDKKDKDAQQTEDELMQSIETMTQEESDEDKDKSSGYDLDNDGYVKWSFPWSLTVNYSVNYSYGDFDYEKLDYKGKWTQNLSFSGRVQPTKGWNFNFSASYDFNAHKLAYMNCTISRDLHCFAMSASFVPVGPYKSYNFHIAVKSAMLRDLKYDKRSSRNNGVDWY